MLKSESIQCVINELRKQRSILESPHIYSKWDLEGTYQQAAIEKLDGVIADLRMMLKTYWELGE